MIDDDIIIAAMLSNKTRAAAAAELGITTRQLYNRLREPGLAKELHDISATVADNAVFSLQNSVETAVETLVGICNDDFMTSEKCRIEAAKALIDYALKVGTVKEYKDELF